MKLRIISWETLENLQKEQDIFIIDLRDREDYEQEHVSGAVWADWERLEEDIALYLNERDEVPHWIALYCDRGNTSLLIARDLARRGYPVLSLNGGYRMWQKLHLAIPTG